MVPFSMILNDLVDLAILLELAYAK